MTSILSVEHCIIVAAVIGLSSCTGGSDSDVQVRRGLAFEDVAPTAGLASFKHENGGEGRYWFPEQMGAGGGFVDYDGDDWEDIVLVGGGRLSPTGPAGVSALRVFRNDRSGSFTDVTDDLGLAGIRAYGTGIASADYDNDGDQDIYLTTLHENLLLRNDIGSGGAGKRTFTEVGQEAGVADPSVWSSSALFLDADLDGFADLYVAGYSNWSPDKDVDCFRRGVPDYCPPATYGGARSQFFRNNGDGTFEDQTIEAGFVGNPGKSLAVAEWDFNEDGYPDIVVVNDGQPDLLYISNRDGTFTERGVLSGTAYGEHGEARAGMGVDVGIVDKTGQPSIFVGNFSSEMVGVYRRTPSGWFADRAASSRIGRASLKMLSFGVLLFDAELDSDLDLFVANGHVYYEPIDGSAYRQPPHLFLNDGQGMFTDVADSVGGVFQEAMVARSVSKADYDRDGDLDLLVTENHGPVRLLRNDSGRGGVLRVRLRGRSRGSDALGSTVTIVAGASSQMQRVRTGSGYLSQSEKTLTFGLGTLTGVDSLTVDWTDGHTETFGPVQADVELSIVEGMGIVSEMAVPIKRNSVVGTDDPATGLQAVADVDAKRGARESDQEQADEN